MITRPVAGSKVSKVRPSAASGRSPPITRRCGPAAKERAASERASGKRGGVGAHAAGCYEKRSSTPPSASSSRRTVSPGSRLVRRGDDPRDDAVARPELLARVGKPRRPPPRPSPPASARSAPPGPCAAPRRSRGCAPAPGSCVSTRGPKATARWKMLPARICSTAEVEVRWVGDLQRGEEGGDRAAVVADLERDLALDDHRVLVPIVLHEAVARQEPGKRRVDSRAAPGSRGR